MDHSPNFWRTHEDRNGSEILGSLDHAIANPCCFEEGEIRMSVKSVVSIAIAILCFAPMSAEAGMWDHHSAGCGCEVAAAPSCGCEASACDPCGRGGRLRGLFAGRRACCAPAPTCCAPAPTCCAPAPVCCEPAPVVCAPAPVCCEPAPVCCDPAPVCCDPCAKPARCGLFSRLQARRAARRACCPAPAAPSCGCAPVAAPSCGCN
jgi:hypothetical protein